MLTERIDPELMTCEQVVAMGRYPYTNHFGSLTPGDRQVVEESLHMVRAEELAERPFTDISDCLLYTSHAEECRFAQCLHVSEPGCAVKPLLDNGKLSRERYERYLQILSLIHI